MLVRIMITPDERWEREEVKIRIRKSVSFLDAPPPFFEGKERGL